MYIANMLIVRLEPLGSHAILVSSSCSV